MCCKYLQAIPSVTIIHYILSYKKGTKSLNSSANVLCEDLLAILSATSLPSLKQRIRDLTGLSERLRVAGEMGKVTGEIF